MPRTKASGSVIRDAGTGNYEIELESVTIRVTDDLHNQLVKKAIDKLVVGASAHIQWWDSEDSELVVDVGFEGLESVKFPLRSLLDEISPRSASKRDAIIEILESVVRRLRALTLDDLS
jgi:hypothetical protein